MLEYICLVSSPLRHHYY